MELYVVYYSGTTLVVLLCEFSKTKLTHVMKFKFSLAIQTKIHLIKKNDRQKKVLILREFFY
ncbi:hypothetical protein BpHYR1_031232 [Brachionus plicatilis]|uniref:Uncharacterized protein n=1 Tax=Brachionus plicatilis TaxID=10195 RepID=A0A3M7RK33_BRAPC|nr:hypothetical protein BpHYR1_031232 [Brachionus plicatilis]